MINLILYLSLAVACPQTIFINASNEPWEPYDRKMYETRQDLCQRKFPKRSPCVIKFIKRGYHTYYVSCGPKKEEK